MNPAPKAPDESTYSGRFAARLRALREKTGMSVEAFVSTMAASGYAVTAKTVYNWESGLREPPLDALPAISQSLKKTIRSLFPEK